MLIQFLIQVPFQVITPELDLNIMVLTQLLNHLESPRIGHTHHQGLETLIHLVCNQRKVLVLLANSS